MMEAWHHEHPMENPCAAGTECRAGARLFTSVDMREYPVNTLLAYGAPMLNPILLLTVVFLVPLSANAAERCPVINGKYSFIEKRADRVLEHSITHFTRQDAGVFSYTVQGTFQVADGVAKPLRLKNNQMGKISLSCDKGFLIVNIHAEDTKTITIFEISATSETEINVRSNIPGRDGIYVKQ